MCGWEGILICLDGCNLTGRVDAGLVFACIAKSQKNGISNCDGMSSFNLNFVILHDCWGISSLKLIEFKIRLSIMIMYIYDVSV